MSQGCDLWTDNATLEQPAISLAQACIGLQSELRGLGAPAEFVVPSYVDSAPCRAKMPLGVPFRKCSFVREWFLPGRVCVPVAVPAGNRPILGFGLRCTGLGKAGQFLAGCTRQRSGFLQTHKRGHITLELVKTKFPLQLGGCTCPAPWKLDT